MIKTSITDELYQYILKFGVRQHPILTKLCEKTSEFSAGTMQIPIDQGQFMGLLATITKATKYLEIGTFMGYSSLVMALGMGKNSEIYTLDVNEQYVDIAKQFWIEAGVEKQIKSIIGIALDSLNNLIPTHKESFDIAFIDANKADYSKYFELCYQLVKPCGLILIDNVLFKGQVLKDIVPKKIKAIKEFNQQIRNDPRVDISMLAIGDGLTIAYKKDTITT